MASSASPGRRCPSATPPTTPASRLAARSLSASPVHTAVPTRHRPVSPAPEAHGRRGRITRMRSDHRDPAARTLGAGANAPAPTAGSLPSGTVFYVNPNSGAHLCDAADVSALATWAEKLVTAPPKLTSPNLTHWPAAVAWTAVPLAWVSGASVIPL